MRCEAGAMTQPLARGIHVVEDTVRADSVAGGRK